jgi:hypothetical protein
VVTPRAVEEEKPAEEEVAAAPTEPELIKKGKGEEEEAPEGEKPEKPEKKEKKGKD